MQKEKCDHVCTSNCRRDGCNCECGEFHMQNIPESFWGKSLAEHSLKEDTAHWLAINNKLKTNIKNQTWEPKYGDTYWYISLGVHGIEIKSSVRSMWFWHERLAKTGNCFPSLELANEMMIKIESLLN